MTRRDAPQDPPPRPGWRVLAQGARLFDAGRHHAAHEVFEDAWREARARERAEADWWQGLVLCAGSLHHRGRGNERGRRALAERAEQRLTAALDGAPRGAWWRDACGRWLEAWRRLAGGGPDPVLGELLDRAPEDRPGASDREL